MTPTPATASPFHRTPDLGSDSPFPLVLAHEPVSPQVDAMLSRLAAAASTGDPMIRNVLYLALQPKIDGIVLAICRRYGIMFNRQFEPADLKNEAFLLYCQVLEEWSPHESFCGHFFGVFPWRLRRVAVKQIRALRLPAHSLAPAAPNYESGPSLLELQRQLGKFSTTLNPFQRDLLVSRLDEGWSLRQFSLEHGVSDTTTRRTWRRIQQMLQRFLDTNSKVSAP